VQQLAVPLRGVSGGTTSVLLPTETLLKYAPETNDEMENTRLHQFGKDLLLEGPWKGKTPTKSASNYG